MFELLFPEATTMFLKSLYSMLRPPLPPLKPRPFPFLSPVVAPLLLPFWPSCWPPEEPLSPLLPAPTFGLLLVRLIGLIVRDSGLLSLLAEFGMSPVSFTSANNSSGSSKEIYFSATSLVELLIISLAQRAKLRMSLLIAALRELSEILSAENSSWLGFSISRRILFDCKQRGSITATKSRDIGKRANCS